MIYFYLISHILGDFYLQSQELSDYKGVSRTGVRIHNIQYSVTFIIVLLFRTVFLRSVSDFGQDLILTLIFISVHAAIDIIKIRIVNPGYVNRTNHAELEYISKRDKFINTCRFNSLRKMAVNDIPNLNQNDSISTDKRGLSQIVIFGLDQICHIVSIFAIYTIAYSTYGYTFYNGQLQNEALILLKMVLAILLVGKPTNILIVMLTEKFDPKYIALDEGLEGAGARMGFLERLLTLLFLSENFISGIAVVFTLKGIARYKKISEDAKFAEYFVIGTFTSLLIVFLVYLIILK